MAKSNPFTLADLEAKGFVADTDGSFVFKGQSVFAKMEIKEYTSKDAAELLKVRPIGLVAIENVLRACQIKFEREYVFSDTRKFRFDIAIHDLKLGIEYEGIFSDKSRHTGMEGYTKDATKYNLAQIEGWMVLRYTAKNYKDFMNDLKQILTTKTKNNG